MWFPFQVGSSSWSFLPLIIFWQVPHETRYGIIGNLNWNNLCNFTCLAQSKHSINISVHHPVLSHGSIKLVKKPTCKLSMYFSNIVAQCYPSRGPDLQITIFSIFRASLTHAAWCSFFAPNIFPETSRFLKVQFKSNLEIILPSLVFCSFTYHIFLKKDYLCLISLIRL